MKKNQGWFPRARPKQLVVINNLKAKITGYEMILPISKDKIDRITLICNTFIALYNFVEQTRATAQQVTDYQNMLLTVGDGVRNAPAPAPPFFQTLTLPVGAFVGILTELDDLVDDIKAANNYTRGIGEDLMVVPPVGEDIAKDQLEASIKPTALANHKVHVEGSLQGMKAMRVEYLKKGGTIPQSFFLTKLPADITIALTVVGEPEAGHLRAFLIDNNTDTGLASPDYPITVG